MSYVGAPHQFLGDVLPLDFRAEIFSLVDAAWPRVKGPFDIWREPRITALLRLALIEVNEAQYAGDTPFHIERESQKCDPKTGKEVERSDIEFHLRYHNIRGQQPYFVFESKRLNVPYGDSVHSEAQAYVGDGGMGHLLAGGYDTVPDHSGMLAYVMDGNIAIAKRSVEKHLASKSEQVRLHGDAKIRPSAWMPKGSPHGETHHTTGSQPTVLFHMFLAVTRPRR